MRSFFRVTVTAAPEAFLLQASGVRVRGGLNFPPPLLVVSASVCIFNCEILRNNAKFICYFSRHPPPWVSRLPPSLRPRPVYFPPLYSRSLSPSTMYAVRLHGLLIHDRIHFFGENKRSSLAQTRCRIIL